MTEGSKFMPHRLSTGALTLAVSLCLSLGGARAFDDGKYPDLRGQWLRATDLAVQKKIAEQIQAAAQPRLENPR